ncbi:hypothetical protein ACTQYZ_09320 [Anaerofustis sp. LCP19S3_F7]|uniref:hypothetical protein n=1 Tax=Anaerofustis sp. LCP19S3_F7 TaxID=3440247 RepID=UPI003F934855
MDNENNRDFLNSEKGEFIVNKKDEDKEKINTMSEKGEFIVNKKIDEEVKNETNKIEEKGEYEYIIITPNK